MGRWFRLDDDVINDPKVLALPEAMRWHWVAILCVASKNNGQVPSLNHAALGLRLPERRAGAVVAGLAAAGLLDKVDGGYFAPHNWDKRQYKSDSPNERVKRFRERAKKQECNVTSAVTVTPPEAETETDRSEAIASGATAPVAIYGLPPGQPIYTDSKHELWGEGVPILVSLGEPEAKARQMVGRWMRDTGDDAVAVLGAIQRARDNRVVGAIAWITRALKTGTQSNAKPGQDDFQRALATLGHEAERLATSAVSDRREDAPRLLSHRGRE